MDTSSTAVEKAVKKRKFSFPTAYTVLFLVLLLATVLTHVIPAGKYAKLTYDEEAKSFVVTDPKGDTKNYEATQQTLTNLGINIKLEKFTSGSLSKPVAIPKTYENVEAHPTSFKDFFMAPIRGFADTQDIMLFVLILGGIIGVLTQTGAINAGFAALSRVTKGKEFVLIVLVNFLISLGGTTFGMAEETIALFPILIPIFLVAGYDAMVGIAAIYLGSVVGGIFSTTNVFATGTASAVAGISPSDGMTFRFIGLVIGVAITLVYLLRYASKVKHNPASSLIYDQRQAVEASLKHMGHDVPPFTKARALMILVFVSAFFILTWGVSSQDWWFAEMSMLFLIVAFIIILLAIFFTGLSEKQAMNSFISGSADLVGVGLSIGIARGVNFLLEDGSISDTILFYAANSVQGMSPSLFIIVVMLIYVVLGFFIQSSSGLAVLSIPIIAPLADTVGLPRDTVVSAFQYGQGIMSFVAPTGLILVVLSLFNITFDRWLKFVLPIMGIISVLAVIMLMAQVHFG
ncbi:MULTISPECIES: YfcC family protein [unclassified Moraxella]|uniref:YfcC family protein n=1 Tax=unclassified Moraxella TaxID=2685852 RepID=UPI003AF71F74